jgi:very-long-chain (3R)-3-hydroxyacyl-CoA dehydratase
MNSLNRYPYYMLHVFNVNVKFLTWMRYTVWIFLYPLGFLFEGITQIVSNINIFSHYLIIILIFKQSIGLIIFHNIVYFEESQKFSLYLPNSLNFSFHLPSILRLYLLIGLFPGIALSVISTFLFIF